MNVLVVTGDRRFVKGNPRFDLQASAVAELHVLYWGRGALWPKVLHEQVDVVTCQDPFWRGVVGWYLARKLKAKFNVQVHTDLEASAEHASQKSSAAPRLLSSVFRLRLAKFVLRHADSVRVVTEKLKKQVEDMGTKARISVLPIYIDIERFKNVERQPHDKKRILWLGRFEEEKDPMRALDIIKIVLSAGVDATLTMLGAGTLEQKLKTAAAGQSVEFPGWQDAALFLGRTDVVLCTSVHESYGASMIEALAAGVPVVAPDIGVAKEAGAIVVARNELAEATIQVLQTSERGMLKMKLLTAEEWTKQWRESL